MIMCLRNDKSFKALSSSEVIFTSSLNLKFSNKEEHILYYHQQKVSLYFGIEFRMELHNYPSLTFLAVKQNLNL